MILKILKNLIFVAFNLINISPSISYLKNDFSSSQIILFYAPLNSELIKGQIVIYWNNVNFKNSDIVGLHYGHPLSHGSEFLFIYAPENKSGIIKTKISPERALYSLEKTYEEQCVGYYGSWIRDGKYRKVSCLSTHPDWMYKHREIFGNMTIGSLFLPGTHNSGSYESLIPQSLIQRYTITQDGDVFDQLVSGSRYLDIRPCKMNSLNEYWVCHGSFPIRPLNGIIYDIKDFLTNTHEIVIISFKEFSGFVNINDHLDFIEKLTTWFEDFLCPRLAESVFTITLNTIWTLRKKLIISYNHPINKTEFYFWPTIFQFWPNVLTRNELFSSIDKFENHHLRNEYLDQIQSYLSATMAEITLDAGSIILDVFASLINQGEKSLLQLAIEIGPLVTMWYNENFTSSAAIVAVDYIDATGIVEVAIQANIHRASQRLNGNV